MSDLLQRQDPAVWASLQRESARQRDNIELIASENYVSAAVREVVGSVLTNKYAEGYPGKRYYGGCEAVDAIEVLAIERAKALFGAEHANVQPHAGSSTNAAAYAALLSPGDPVLAMSLAAGGHLTHGAPVSLTGTYYAFTHYGVDPDTEQIDYEAVHALAKQCRPKLIVAGITAYPRQVDFARFAEIAGDVGAYLLVDMAHLAGLVAAGLHPSPMPHADVVTTSTHKTLRGPRGGLILCREQHAKAIDRAVFPGLQGGPLMHVIAGKAVAFAEAATPAFGEYQKQVIHNAQALGAGLTHHGFRLVTGGTDTHMLLVDLGATADALTGKQAERLLDAVHITVNKNAIPRDTRPAAVTSGLRLGSPAVTTRGLREPDMARIADYMAQALSDGRSEADTTRLAEAVRSWISEFPLP